MRINTTTIIVKYGIKRSKILKKLKWFKTKKYLKESIKLN